MISSLEKEIAFLKKSVSEKEILLNLLKNGESIDIRHNLNESDNYYCTEILKYKFIIENTSEEFYLISRSGAILLVNAAASDSVGRRQTELQGEHISVIEPDKTPDKYNSFFKRLKAERVINCDVVHIGMNGRKHTKEMRYVFMELSGSEFACAFGHDITNKIKTLNSLKESEERYRALMANLPEIVIIHYQEKIIYANDTLAKLTGHHAQEVYGKSILDIIDIQSRNDFFSLLNNSEEEKIGNDFYNIDFISKNGTIIRTEGKSILIHIHDQLLNLTVFSDVTKRKIFEDMISEEYSILDKIIMNNPVAMAIFGNEGNYIKSNSSFNEIFGSDFNEDYSVFDEEFLLEHREKMEVLRNGGTIEINRILYNPSKSNTGVANRNYYLNITGFPITSVDGKIDRFVAIVENVSEKKLQEENMLKSLKLESLGILAGGIAHDFNNILTAILGNISLAKLWMGESESKIKKAVLDAEKASIKAKDLTHQLLTLSKGGLPVKSAASAYELILDSVDLALHGSAVICEFDIQDDIWNVDIDESQISQVLHNLLLNARQAMNDSGKISVKCSNYISRLSNEYFLENGKYVKFQITDNGAGIPPEVLPNIFDPYFTTKPTGHGLGLAISYSIVKNHSGHIDVQSAVGKGTSFSLYLPASESEVSIKDTNISVPLKKDIRLLILEDEDNIVTLLSRIFDHYGYEAEFCYDGESAVIAFEKSITEDKPFDAVLLDLTIPGGLGGKETFLNIIKIDPNVKGIVSSGYSNDDAMSNYSQYGFSARIVKPYNIEELIQTITEVISK